MRTLGIGAVLSIAAAALLGVGSLSPGWYEVESSQTMRVGPLGAERCGPDRCGSTTLDRFGAGSGTQKLGLAVALGGVLAGLSLLAAVGLHLSRSESRRFAAKVALVLTMFAVCCGLAFHILTPFSELMTIGLPAFAYFGGAALAGATAAIPLGAVRSSG